MQPVASADRKRAPLEGFLQRRIDPILERLMRVGGRFELRDPVRWALAPHRRRAMRETLAAVSGEADALAAGVIAREPGAIERFDRLAAAAIDRMRASRPTGLGVRRWLDAVERPLYRDEPEILDDPSVPADERTVTLDLLDRLNHHAGIYTGFLRALDPLLGAATPTPPMVVHDLAAGHGGFALLLKSRLRDRVVVEASDLRSEYLELGESRARAMGLDVRFVVQDALDLGSLRGSVDVLSCTQSLHHFGPGMVARLVGEAARSARIGVCFVDGERRWLTLGLLAPMVALYGRNRTFVHDATVSVRRMFYEEELALLAALAPGVPQGARIETGTVAPAHAFVRIRLPER
jgi:2-polyprenyl-3-methyl-5-hydroxy-6-metoxy-1,4-benzoquinol methylase